MAIILISRTEQLATVGELTEEEIKIVKTMVTVGNSLEDIENHLLRQDHIVLGNDNNKSLSILFIKTKFNKEHFQELFNDIMKMNNL